MLFFLALVLLVPLLWLGGCATSPDIIQMRKDLDSIEGDVKALERKWTTLTDEVVIQTGALTKALDDVKRMRASSTETAKDIAQTLQDTQRQEASLEALVQSLRRTILRTYQVQIETLQKLAAEVALENVSGDAKSPEPRGLEELRR
jgi:septal ring factor EnvC (AmiA/AmiB activator)